MQLFAERDHIAFDVPVHGHTARKRDEVAVHVAIDSGGVGRDDQIGVYHFTSGERVIGIAVLDLRRLSRRGEREGHYHRAHHHGERGGAPQVAPQQPDHQNSECGQRQKFGQASHRVPSFPECTAEKQHGQKIALRETGLRRLRPPRFDEPAPHGVRTARAQSKGREPTPGCSAALRSLHQMRGHRLVIGFERLPQPDALQFQRAQQVATVVTGCDMSAHFLRVRRVELLLEIQQRGHLIEVIHGFPPAAAVRMPPPPSAKISRS